MKRQDVENLEKVTGQLEGFHREISLLAKKSPTDALNGFKLKMLNSALAAANIILDAGYKPIDGFTEFDPDDVPSNSDVTVVLAMYLEELERYRADKISRHTSFWYFVIEDGDKIRAASPKRLREK